LCVFVLPEIHDATHRRLGFRRDFDEVEFLLAGRLERRGDRHDAELLAVRAHDTHFPDTDAFVDTDVLGLADRCGSSLAASRGVVVGRAAGRRGAGARSAEARHWMDDAFGRSADHERPTVRLASRAPISRTRSASTRSSGTAPRSSPVRWRRLTVPFSASRAPTTRSNEPRIARWTMTGRLGCPSLSMYSRPKRSGCWKSTWMVAFCQRRPIASCTSTSIFGP